MPKDFFGKSLWLEALKLSYEMLAIHFKVCSEHSENNVVITGEKKFSSAN